MSNPFATLRNKSVLIGLALFAASLVIIQIVYVQGSGKRELTLTYLHDEIRHLENSIRKLEDRVTVHEQKDWKR